MFEWPLNFIDNFVMAWELFNHCLLPPFLSIIPRICTGSTKKISGTHWESYLIQQYSDGVFRRNGALSIAVFEEKNGEKSFIRELVFGLVLHVSDTSQFSLRSHRQFFFSIYLITLCISFGSCKAAGTENTPAVSVLKKSVPRRAA